MSNANFITRFEYRLNNLTGSELEHELNALRATADLHPSLNLAAVALLDAAIDAHAQNLTNSSSIEDLVVVGNACADKRSTRKSTQRGTGSIIGIGSFDDITLSAVDQNKCEVNIVGATYNSSGSSITYEFTSDTNLRITSHSNNTSHYSWEVLENV